MKRIHAMLLLIPLLVLGISSGVEAANQTWSLVYENYHPDTLRVHVNLDAVTDQPILQAAIVHLAYDTDQLEIEIDTLTLFPFSPVLLPGTNWLHFLYDFDAGGGVGNTNYGGFGVSGVTMGPGTAFTFLYAYQTGYDFNSVDNWMTICSTWVNEAAVVQYHPDVPVLLSPPNGGTADNTPLFDWSGTAGPKGTYTLEVSTSSDFSSGVQTITGITTDHYEMPTLMTPGDYYWRVEAFDHIGRASGFQASPFAVEVLACTMIPDAPIGAVDTACSGTEFGLSWAADQYAEWYELRVDGGGWMNLGNVTEWTGNRPAGVYDYDLRACNADCGCSDASPTTTITVQDALEAPAAPTINPASVCTGDLYCVSWTLDPNAESYELQENGVWTPVGLVSQYCVSKGTAGIYTYRVRAFDHICGSGEPSDSVLIDVGGALAAPGDLDVDISPVCIGHDFCLTWPSVVGAASYQLRVDDGTWAGVGTDTTHCITADTQGEFDYEVRAYTDACGGSTGDPSPLVTVTVTSAEAPGQPIVDDSIVCVDDEFCISWTAVTGATAYEVSEDDGTWTNIGSGTSHCVTKTAVGDYAYKVRAISDICGPATASDPSPAVTVEVDGYLLGIDSIRCDYDGGSSYTIDWRAVEGARSYYIYILFTDSVSLVDSADGTDTSFTGEMPGGDPQGAAMTAVNACGESSLQPTDCDFASDVFVISDLLPDGFELKQNYPNPFNPETFIEFSLPRASHVSLEVYNLLGRRVKTLVNGHLSAGSRVVTWDGTDDSGRPASSGVYFYKLNSSEFNETKKMVLMK